MATFKVWKIQVNGQNSHPFKEFCLTCILSPGFMQKDFFPMYCKSSSWYFFAFIALRVKDHGFAQITSLMEGSNGEPSVHFKFSHKCVTQTHKLIIAYILKLCLTFFLPFSIFFSHFFASPLSNTHVHNLHIYVYTLIGLSVHLTYTDVYLCVHIKINLFLAPSTERARS